MKKKSKLFLLIFFMQVAVVSSAADYFSVASGDASDKTIWNSSRDGKGIAPTNFNDPNDNFIIQDNHVVSSNANTFSCKGSLIIENGGLYITGSSANTTIATALSINPGGVFQLQKGSTLNVGVVLIQGLLKNLGGNIITGSPPLMMSGK